jgi:hypothetical protein
MVYWRETIKMTVQELIDELLKIEDKTQEITIDNDYSVSQIIVKNNKVYLIK